MPTVRTIANRYSLPSLLPRAYHARQHPRCTVSAAEVEAINFGGSVLPRRERHSHAMRVVYPAKQPMVTLASLSAALVTSITLLSRHVSTIVHHSRSVKQKLGGPDHPALPSHALLQRLYLRPDLTGTGSAVLVSGNSNQGNTPWSFGVTSCQLRLPVSCSWAMPPFSKHVLSLA